MHSVEASALSPKERYFYLVGAVAPRPIAFVSTVSKEGKTNLAPFSFFNAFASNPPILIFSAATTADPERPYKDTYLNIIETKECVVQMVNYQMAEQMNLCSKDLSYGESEFDFSGLTPIASDLVAPPRVKEAPIQMECKLLEMKSIGDGPGSANLAICEVLKFHIADELIKGRDDDKVRIDPYAADLIGRNGEFYYTRASGDSLFELKRPA